MAFTFIGGVHPKENKNTASRAIRRLPSPKLVYIPLSQHIGVPCTPTVNVGDTVKKGEMLGDVPQDKLGVPVHSSVSGTVREISSIRYPDGRAVECVIVENDLTDTQQYMTPYDGSIKDLHPQFIIERVRQAGIAGMGGASFPTYAKITSALGRVNRIIINCCECEPYICADNRLLIEYPEAVIGGAKLLMRALGLRKCDIALEDNKLSCVPSLKKAIKDPNMFDIRIMKTKYPQGDERQLVYALTGVEIPFGKLPADVGCVIFNAATCCAVFEAVALGKPLIERAVTVDGGAVKHPKNVYAPIGTPVSELLEFCSGTYSSLSKLIVGGAMMGTAQYDTNLPVTKGTNAVLALSYDETEQSGKDGTCIRCGRCVRACPMRLQPLYLASYARAGKYDKLEKYDIFGCVECGSCAYSCPGGVPIVQLIRGAKAKLKSDRSEKNK